MGSERTSNAVARIERAFARIEAAVDRSPPAHPDTVLLRQNQELRETVDSVLSEIDGLIERLGE